MSIWLFLWVVLSIILLGATAWSTWILIQQKQAWRSYAAKHGLTYMPGRFFESPQMEGVIEGYNVSFFSATQMHEDSRKNRQRTVLQLNINNPMVNGLGAGTPEMLPFLKTLDILSAHDLKGREGWNASNALFSVHPEKIEAYLTPERLKALASILSIPNADILVLIEEEGGAVRIETGNPLESEKTVDALVKKLLARVKKLEIDEEERQNINSVAPQTGAKKEPQEVAQETNKVEKPEEKPEGKIQFKDLENSESDKK
ncbi:MAG: hypothetical protein MRY79_05780 [Alphaproteobacteria bacterium]|nr:hypothetical protein [Alphaproteobacteria bacterium]